MNTFTQRVIETAMRWIEYAISQPQGSALAIIITRVAETLIAYAIAFDPPPEPPTLPADIEQLRTQLKAATDRLATAVSHNQPS